MNLDLALMFCYENDRAGFDNLGFGFKYALLRSDERENKIDFVTNFRAPIGHDYFASQGFEHSYLLSHSFKLSDRVRVQRISLL